MECTSRVRAVLYLVIQGKEMIDCVSFDVAKITKNGSFIAEPFGQLQGEELFNSRG